LRKRLSSLVTDIGRTANAAPWQPALMPRFLHEALRDPFLDNPPLAAQLLRDRLHVPVPHFTEARTASADLSQLVPVEFRADGVVLLEHGRPVFAIVVQVQLEQKARKRFVWPAYAGIVFAKYEPRGHRAVRRRRLRNRRLIGHASALRRRPDPPLQPPDFAALFRGTGDSGAAPAARLGVIAPQRPGRPKVVPVRWSEPDWRWLHEQAEKEAVPMSQPRGIAAVVQCRRNPPWPCGSSSSNREAATPSRALRRNPTRGAPLSRRRPRCEG